MKWKWRNERITQREGGGGGVPVLILCHLLLPDEDFHYSVLAVQGETSHSITLLPGGGVGLCQQVAKLNITGA